MKILVERDKLLVPVSLVAGVVERRQTLPILAYLLLRATDNKITMIGTDLEVEMVATVEGKVKEAGDMTVPARKLLDICRALPDGAEIGLTKQGSKVALRAGKSRFTLTSLVATDFPKVETETFDDTLQLTASLLKRVLEATSFCMALQDVRYYLNGVYIELENRSLRAVATDGHRMAVSEATLEQDVPTTRHFIVPRKAVQEILRLLPNDETTVNLMVGQNHLRLTVSGLTVTSKLIDGKFPDYRKVIPTGQTKILILEREVFREALNRAAILANEKYRGVRLNLEPGKLSITAHNPDQEEAVEEVEVTYNGEPLEIGFNVNYLTDATSAVSSPEIRLGLSDASSSCTLQSPSDSSTEYIVMPMRL